MPFDILGAASGALGAIDLPGKVVEMAAGALGLPPEVTNAAKVGIGIATGNPIMAASGAVGLAGNVLANAAETEMAPPGTGGGAGYAGGSGNQPPSGPLPWQSNSSGIFGGLMSIYKGFSDINRTASEKVGELLLDGKNEAGFKKLNNTVHDSGLSIVSSVLGNPNGRAAFEKGFACKVDPQSIPSGQIKFSGDYSADWTNRGSPLDPSITQYREAIDVVRANWATFDTASTRQDGLVQRADIQAIASNPNASEVMRNAAQFLIDNPEYFNRLEVAAGIGGKDGTIGFVDLTAEVKRVNAEIKEYGLPDTRATGKTAYEDRASPISSDSKVGGILNDKSMTLEEKLDALMNAITSDIDEELGDTMKKLDSAYGKSTKGSDGKEDASKAQAKQGAIDKITRKLQQLMERRKQMVELSTNMSKNFNDMAMSAIRNMR